MEELNLVAVIHLKTKPKKKTERASACGVKMSQSFPSCLTTRSLSIPGSNRAPDGGLCGHFSSAVSDFSDERVTETESNTPVISAFGGLGQEDHESETNLGYIARFCLQNNCENSEEKSKEMDQLVKTTPWQAWWMMGVQYFNPSILGTYRMEGEN